MDNETKIKIQFQNNVSGEKAIEKYAKELEKIYGLASSLNKGQLAQMTVSVNKAKDSVTETTESVKKLGSKFSNIFNVAKITAFTKAAEGLFTSLSRAATKSSAYIENVNLLEVAYKNANETIEESSQRIEAFIDKMSEAYGFDESRLTRQFGIFKQLANAMRLPAEEGERLSEIMVKMTNDVASLYNLDLERASNALQSALVGQTRPIRGATGADITEKTLQTTVDALGLDRENSQLSFVEKRLIMVISLTNQLKVSQGDYARTIESASNQIRVMKEQWDRLSRAVGNVFYPILQKILPYINGVLMALTEIFNLLASLLGFEMPEFDYSSLSGTSDAALDLMDNLEGAGDNVDKLASKMKGLRGFDKLNVINTPSSSGGASVSGGGIGGAVDPKIMDAFNKAFSQYDDLMDSVRMKARDIRDSIMEWLGFTKQIDPITGEISWEYEGISKTLSNMWNSFMKLNPLAKAFVGFGVWKAFKALWEWGGKLLSILGVSGIFATFKNLLSIGGEVTTRTQKFQKLRFENSLKKIGDRLKLAGVGAAGAMVSFAGMQSSIKSMITDGNNLGNTLGSIASGMGSVASGAMIGTAILPGWGTAIGAIAGGIMSVVAALTTASKKRDTVQELLDTNKERLDAFTESLQAQYEQVEKNASQNMTKAIVGENLVSELEKVVDANGKVKKGYEARANFIVDQLNTTYGLEIKMVDGVIQEYDKQIKKAKEVIAQEKAKIYQQMAAEKYKIALENQLKVEEELNKAIAQRKGIEEDTKLSEEERIEKLKEADEQVRTATKNLEKNQEAIANYEGITEAIIEGNSEQIDKYQKKIAKTTSEIDEDISDSYVARARLAAQYYKTNLKEMDKNYKDLSASEKEFVDRQLKEFTDMFQQGVKEVGEITPEMVASWKEMSEQSEEAFMIALGQLPEDMQQEVVDKMQSTGQGISTQLQKGINDKFPKIQIKPELLSPSAQEMKNLANKITQGIKIQTKVDLSLSGFGFKADGGIFANGKWHDIAQYATGTANAPVGQMFVARERGPELVGTIGGHTAVMNNDQIVSSVASGVYNAVRAANTNTSREPQIFNIYLDKDNKIATYMLDKFDDMAKSNGKAIEIGG